MAEKNTNEVTYEEYDFNEISADSLAQLDDAMKNGTLFQGATVKSTLDRYAGKILEYMDSGRSAKDIAMAFSRILKMQIAVKDVRACANKAKKLRERRVAAIKRRRESALSTEGETTAESEAQASPKKSNAKKTPKEAPKTEPAPAEQPAAADNQGTPIDGAADNNQKEKSSWF